MKHKNKIISSIFLLALAFFSVSCEKQQTGNASAPVVAAEAVKAESPTEAFKVLFEAVKAKDSERIRQMMSKSTLAFAEGYAAQTKQTVNEALRNGFTGPTLADTLPQMRDERVKDNFGALEVFNPKTNLWDDVPFVLEDGGWKLAVGDIFQNTYKLPGKGQAQIEREASNTGVPMPANSVADFPPISEGNKSAQVPPSSGVNKSIEVPKEDKPKK